MRLPGIGRLLAGGILTRSKAKLVAQVFEPLGEDEAARAEALILGDLDGRTYPQVERLACRAALAVAPDVAERRRVKGERQARVTVFREQAGTAGVSGRDLPAGRRWPGTRTCWPAPGRMSCRGRSPARDQPAAGAGVSRPANGVRAGDRIAFAATAARNRPVTPARTPRGGPGPEPSGRRWRRSGGAGSRSAAAARFPAADDRDVPPVTMLAAVISAAMRCRLPRR